MPNPSLIPLCVERSEEGIRFAAGGPARIELGPAVPRVVFRRGGLLQEWTPPDLVADGERFVARRAADGLRLELCCEARGGAWLLRAILRNDGAESIRVEELVPLCARGEQRVRVGSGRDRWSVFRNGYQSWSGTGAFPAAEADRDPLFDFLRISTNDYKHRSGGRPGVIRSDLLTAIHNTRSGESLCLGFVETARAFGAITVFNEAGRVRVEAGCDFDGVELAPGAALASEALWLAAGTDPHALLEAWAEAAGAAMKARVAPRSPAGWCSWYYYFTKIDEGCIFENLGRLEQVRDRFACDYVQVDDGYQRAIGDWLETNEKFPRGMGRIAEHIREAGFEPGIWYAPFLVRPDSRLFREHGDWLVRRPDGRLQYAIWNPVWSATSLAYALDTTHPDALEWVESVARTIARQWGYGVLKLDFLFAAALPGRRYDANATRAEALRRGLEAIRRGAGEEAFLLGCGCPLGPAIGVVDGMRIGADVAPFWTLPLLRLVMRDRHGVATKHAIRNILTRAFMHRRLWLNDPDCLMVRADETRLTAAEVRTLAAAIALTDGMFVVSDRMDRLPSDRIELLRTARALSGGKPYVADLFEKGMPEVLVSRRAHDTLVAVFNFADQPLARTLDLGRIGVAGKRAMDAWSGQPVSCDDGWIDLGVIPAHGCRVVRVTSDG